MTSPRASHLTRRVLRFTFYVLILLTTAWAPYPQGQEIVITGQVTNGTPGGTVPADLPVTIHIFSGLEETETYTTTVTADNTFSLDGLAPEGENIFMARAVYQDVVYVSDLVTVEAEQTEIDLPVTIYETTESPDNVQITHLHLFITSVEGHIQVREYHMIGNTGDRTFVGVEDTETEQRVTLNVTLPDGAESLSFDGPGLGERFLEQESGFTDTEPIIPGEATITQFNYLLPYREGTLVERVFGVPVASVVILLSDEGMEVDGEGIFSGDPMDTQMGQALSYTAGPLAAGEPLTFRLIERAVVEQTGGGTREQRDTGTGGTAFGLVALAAALVVIYWMWWRSPAPEPPPARARSLVKKIAALDDDFEAGQVAERTYHKKRKALRRDLRSLLAEQPNDQS